MQSSSSKSSYIGPQLPPGFNVGNQEREVEESLIGPALPPSLKCSVDNSKKERAETSVIGPSLPPHLRVKDSYGPALPPRENSRKVIGPVLPNTGLENSDESDDEGIGPKLYEAADAEMQNTSTAASDFERRAEKMKNKLLNKDSEVNKREEWMTELPSRLGPQIGMGPRSFKKQAYVGKDDDRSEWTDTPADRKRKAEMDPAEVQGPSVEDIIIHRRNQEISENLQKFNDSKRKESLMEIHQKKRKQKEKEKAKPERKEFNRDTDLNIQKLDAKQAKNIIDKARFLNGKFSHGTSHFL